MSSRWKKSRDTARRLSKLQRRVWIAEALVGPVTLAILVPAAIGAAWWLARRARARGQLANSPTAEPNEVAAE
jgi:hypothetical protein